MKKVVKFGGSSLASAEQFKKVGDIIRADEGRRYVVPSAPGKRNSADTKVTDMLYDCYLLYGHSSANCDIRSSHLKFCFAKGELLTPESFSYAVKQQVFYC